MSQVNAKAFIIFSLLACIQAEKLIGGAKRHQTIRERVEEFVHEDPERKQDLKCTGCAYAVYELQKAFQKESHPDERLDLGYDVCDNINQVYGLRLKDDVPVAEFTRDPVNQKMKGPTIGNFLLNPCMTLLDNYEEDVMNNFNLGEREYGLMLCRDRLGLCQKYRDERNKGEL
ncbi:hypothetical protein CYMTET_7776 [Cymbomonas tetramitiformis]|uniref:Saposin B-type domain-containing protein n=1 Tax=Cymbomonas tetramitiformis TaxID=36881 RepID=A0AAE0LGR2_9CHLO|nr:hypothetical protein CYMTET_7776 [Cymbomonas tetramitiformis]